MRVPTSAVFSMRATSVQPFSILEHPVEKLRTAGERFPRRQFANSFEKPWGRFLPKLADPVLFRFPYSLFDSLLQFLTNGLILLRYGNTEKHAILHP